MKKKEIIVFVTLLLFIYSCESGSISSPKPDKNTTTPKKPTWKLTWHDKFNRGDTLDTDKWSFHARNRPGSSWERYCTESNETLYVKDGKLYLRGMINSDTGKYQTGCIETKGKFSFKYGKIKIKAKFVSGKGSWPAIWLMPQEAKYGNWPRSGEIDIMEHLNTDNQVYQTVHSQYTNIQNKKYPSNTTKASIDLDEFNVYELKWSSDRLEFIINDRKTFVYPRKKTSWKQWPFKQKFYLILDQALGGSNTWPGSIHDKDLPVEMVVDWVRVYKNMTSS